MKRFLYGICSLALILIASFFSYRVGYCNACDKYIDASACKPMRKIGLFRL